MSMTDPIADLLTRVRNAANANHRSVDVPASKLKREIARVLAEERFIDNFAYFDDGKQGQLRLYLRYTADNASIIQGLRRMSKPGLRRYAAKGDLPRIRRGLGVAIVSTSRGVMTDRDARKAGVGGEILCSVW
ncbi:MAG TPA: 30S ribosomal protein S8 [Candidatus Latescibacteria bacterium]|jgi:small subunit ribosomal protein S8|nr:30S ribosomal protein S8 [Candidatus Latescibacterota bacterium]|tara:strand:- start:1153 stop:1551 length:399 start_codon:yes stop_codon:yes gene_type:complete